MKIQNEMFTTVNKLLEQYIGGQIFFTELDKAVKFNKEILEELNKVAYDNFAMYNPITIASGEIGLSMHNMGVSIDLLTQGGLRFDPSKINLEPFKSRIDGRAVLFIDDSYFSGKTALVVKEEVERLGGRWLGTLVAYDGAKVKDDKVYSLYRYYDYHDILGRPLKRG